MSLWNILGHLPSIFRTTEINLKKEASEKTDPIVEVAKTAFQQRMESEEREKSGRRAYERCEFLLEKNDKDQAEGYTRNQALCEAISIARGIDSDTYKSDALKMILNKYIKDGLADTGKTTLKQKFNDALSFEETIFGKPDRSGTLEKVRSDVLTDLSNKFKDSAIQQSNLDVFNELIDEAIKVANRIPIPTSRAECLRHICQELASKAIFQSDKDFKELINKAIRNIPKDELEIRKELSIFITNTLEIEVAFGKRASCKSEIESWKNSLN